MMSMHQGAAYDWVDVFHIALALGIAAAYMSVPFTTLRRLPLTPGVKTMAMIFFATCAITHLALAIGFHDSVWMLFNDFAQLVSITSFIVLMARMMGEILKRREAFDAVQDRLDEQDTRQAAGGAESVTEKEGS
jgi:hypothetical protein